MILFEKAISGRLQKRMISTGSMWGRTKKFQELEGGRLAFHSRSFGSIYVCRLPTKIFKIRWSKVNILKLVSEKNAF